MLVLLAGMAALMTVTQGSSAESCTQGHCAGDDSALLQADVQRHLATAVHAGQAVKNSNQMRADDFPFYQIGTLAGLQSDDSVLS
jgi:hypothetical protein